MCFQRLSFGDFSLARQRKVTAPPGAYPGALSRSEKNTQKQKKALAQRVGKPGRNPGS
jgi:hypothetical protein